MNGSWWEKSVFYEIYMPSFNDGNGDGIGDFNGIIEKLDYLKSLGIDGIWLTPFYESPKIDNGYDISDYFSIDKNYGTMEDFHQFIEEAHQRGIKVIADIVLNHTSSEHQWFKESKTSLNHPKRNWYIWESSRDNGAPNNWESFFGGSAWELDGGTDQYYYHAFSKEQVDLNWTQSEVKKAMFEVMKFWLDKGLDGFRFDVINFLKVQQEIKDNPFDVEKNEQIHHYDKDQDGILDTIKEIASFCHSYKDTFLVGEVGSDDLEVLKKYCGKDRLDVVFNFNLGSIETLDVERMYLQLQKMESAYRDGQLPTLFFGSHDMGRFISRFGERGVEEERAKVAAALMLTAKGVPFIYFGDEIGMRDLYIEEISRMRDVQGITAYELAMKAGKTEAEAIIIANEKGRDKSRSPMQWNERDNFGFSPSEPWILFPEVDEKISVSWQENRNGSMLVFYKTLLSCRKAEVALHSGQYERLEKQDEVIFYIKAHEDEKVLVLLNFGKTSAFFKLGTYINNKSYLLLSSCRSQLVLTETLDIFPYEALLIKI